MSLSLGQRRVGVEVSLRRGCYRTTCVSECWGSGIRAYSVCRRDGVSSVKEVRCPGTLVVSVSLTNIRRIIRRNGKGCQRRSDARSSLQFRTLDASSKPMTSIVGRWDSKDLAPRRLWSPRSLIRCKLSAPGEVPRATFFDLAVLDSVFQFGAWESDLVGSTRTHFVSQDLGGHRLQKFIIRLRNRGRRGKRTNSGLSSMTWGPLL